MDRLGLRERCYTPAPTAPPYRPTACPIATHHLTKYFLYYIVLHNERNIDYQFAEGTPE